MSSVFGMIMKRRRSGPFAVSFFAPPHATTIAATAITPNSNALRIDPPLRRPTATLRHKDHKAHEDHEHYSVFVRFVIFVAFVSERLAAPVTPVS
jgi:hypothetical protein